MRRWTFAVSTLLLGGLLGVVPAQSPAKATPEGSALVKGRCTRCHSIAQINRAEKDRKGWEETVDRMIGMGARLNAEEREAVLAYLSGR